MAVGTSLPARRILVVDDNQDAANSLAKYLKRVAGHEVEVAYDGPEALGSPGSSDPTWCFSTSACRG